MLAKEDAKILLLSKYGLDTQPYNNNLKSIALPPYHNNYTSVTWEICTLRQWLNEMFYDYSFSDEEKKLIWLSKLDNPDNPKYGTKGGNPTADRIFLLSINEAEKYLDSREKIFCLPTEWALRFGADENVDPDDGSSDWWLRSPGFDSGRAALIYSHSKLPEDRVYYGRDIRSTYSVVRPALWLLYL